MSEYLALRVRYTIVTGLEILSFDIGIVTLEGRRCVLWRHEHDQWLAEEPRQMLEDRTVVGVDNQEQRLPRERHQVAGVQAA